MIYPVDYINKVICGDCLGEMRKFPDNCIDAIVTDPPAGISFMGKEWDSFASGNRGVCRKTGDGNECESPGFAKDVRWDKSLKARDQFIFMLSEIMTEAKRVLKPGGHAFVWALPRTSHWTGTALENAGFEIRDCVYYVFGSGFPKSLDIGKSVDKKLGAERTVVFEGTPVKRMIPGADQNKTGSWIKDNGREYVPIDTIPGSPEARQWSGWGTGLKPATEIWLLCRKPLTPVPNGDIVMADEQIRRLLCQISPVRFAELFSMSNPSASKEVMSDFAQWVVEKLSMEGIEGLSEKMDMPKLPEEEKIFLSIVLLWNNIWVENLKRENRFTTLTISVLTTELRTLNLLTSLITQEIMPDQSISIDGLVQPVKIAGKLFNAVVATLKNILTLIAPEIATEQGIYPAKSENEISEENETKKVSLSEYPAVECWWLCRKPLSEKSVAENVLKWGTGGINIDGGRIPYQSKDDKEQATPQGKCTSKESESIGAKPDAGRNLERIEFERPELRGRFPSHLIHDGSDEVLAGFPDTTGGKPRIGKKGGSGFGYFDDEKTKNTIGIWPGGSGSASRFFYCAKASPSERGEGNTHPTVKPLALMKYLIKLITPPGGIVLDPFAGSGSTLVAAKMLGYSFIGIEKEEEYCAIARARVSKTNTEPPSESPNLDLFPDK